MRIIAGQWKGLQLHSPNGQRVRPTTDRVKESMFNLIGPSLGQSPVVDLFAGSGALGIEALSRGCESAVFVDKSRSSVQVVRDNIARCRLPEQRVQVWQQDWKAAIARLANEEQAISWVFLDPPYHQALWVPVLNLLTECQIRVEEGVVCEHPKQLPLPNTVGCFEMYKERAYGDILLTLYRMRQGSKDDDQ